MNIDKRQRELVETFNELINSKRLASNSDRGQELRVLSSLIISGSTTEILPVLKVIFLQLKEQDDRLNKIQQQIQQLGDAINRIDTNDEENHQPE